MSRTRGRDPLQPQRPAPPTPSSGRLVVPAQVPYRLARARRLKRIFQKTCASAPSCEGTSAQVPVAAGRFVLRAPVALFVPSPPCDPRELRSADAPPQDPFGL